MDGALSKGQIDIFALHSWIKFSHTKFILVVKKFYDIYFLYHSISGRLIIKAIVKNN
jgi:hypothetical protein